MRLAIALAFVLCGCWSCAPRTTHRPSEPSAATTLITVFNDGFHSGFILPYEGAPTILDPQRGQAKAPTPFIEVGFGEALWMQDIDRGALHALRIALWPSDGMLLLVNLADRTEPVDEQHEIRYWNVALTAAGTRAFYAELDRWIDHRRHYERPADDPQFFYASAHRYSLLRNCHDFTIELLRAARFPIGRGGLNTARSLDRAMRHGLERMRRDGVEAIGP